MTLPSPTFVFGLLVLFYLSSFVVFAIVRIATGVSIQRIGYFSIRRVKYTPRDGCTLEFRGIGLNIHRPTFSQPTWLSIVLTEVAVTLDIRELEGNKAAVGEEEEEEEGDARDDRHDPDHGRRHKKRTPSRNTSSITRSETWKRLTNIKEKIKKLHRRIDWLRMVDVVARDSTLTVQDVGSVQVGTFTIAVDTRTKMVDRARLFFQRSQAQRRKRQAEWIITLRSVLFTAEGNESIEVLDHIVLNIHGFLYEGRDGLRNATISLKLGRVHLPVDDMLLCAHRYKQSRNAAKPTDPEEPLDIFLGGVMQEVEQPGSTNEDLMRTVSDSKEFFSSILRGIKEVQFAVSSVGLTKKVESIRSAASPILLNATMKEVGIDLHRLDPKSPAHRMYFPSKDIAHEALAAALSISVGLDDGHGRPERIVYIPMATTTVRTTLPSKTVERTSDESLEGKNANILFANSVVTSPSVDLDPRHLPLLIALLQPKPKPKPKKPATRQERRHLISRLLPKANIKFSMHEPVLRIKLKPLKKTDDPDDYDLIISSISSISLDMESSHSVVEDLHYSLDGALRLQSHHLYYQTNFDERFNLITTESFDMKVHLAARPDVSVDASGNIQSFSISMVRPEITDGLRQIVRELHIDVEPDKRRVSKTSGQRNFLRSMPDWLLRYHIEATDFNVEVAGIDEDISDDTRGVSLHLDHLSAEYRAQRIDGLQRRTLGRRSHSRSLTQSDSEAMDSSASSKIKKKTQMPGDGRKLVLHARGIDAQIMGSADNAEAEPFVTVPRLELAFSASSDKHGPLFNIQTTVRSIMMQYSLYRHYAVGVAVMTLRKAFMKTNRDSRPRPRQQGTYLSPDLISPDRASSSTLASTLAPELTTIDIKAVLVQIKADFPHEPRMMLHLYGLETGQNRWATPFLTSKLVRVFVEAPRMQNVWARLLSIKSARVDLREARRKTSSGAYVEEKMVDVNGDAVRFAVSHEVIVNRITDNIVNVVKSVQQLHHRFKTGTNEYILDKKPEGPKKVPKVSFRARNFLFELEDGAFEWKLGMIYRTGKIEQIQRIAREEAFEMKMKKIWEEEVRHGGHKLRSRSTAAVRGRTEAGSSSWFRSRSEDSDRNHRRQGLDRGRAPRYQPDKETIGVNASAKVAEEEARIHMHIYNSQTWKKRIDRACKMTKSMVEDFREVFWGGNHLPDDIEETEDILDVPHRPALMSALVSDLHLTIDKPTFALQEVPDFLHRIGKGMPRDMKYGLLVPMHVTIEMDEARVTLRDYPLPLLHIPTLKIGQSARLPAVSMKTNFVIAEEFRGPESTRKVRVSIIPPRSSDPAASNEGSFAIEVRRTIGPVKMYSDIFMDINTALPTRITWGPCYQPAIQDMMMAIEGFTKPQVDLSERVGFWDKIRLNFHSRINIAWKGDGEMHLSLKGTRDPYHVTGAGAGFLMCWRNDVRWGINTHDDPKSFMTVDSGEYIMAIPDYSHCVRQAAMFRSDEANRIEEAARSGAAFKKVVMKLSGKVQWMMGLMFERAIENGVRSFNFKPHYEVVLKNPHFAKDVDGVPYDAMRGFRSRHIHLSIAVRAPVDREWLSETPQPSRSYNTIHVTPRFFTHFFSWWKLFGQPLSLPIRQGSLFPGREKNSKKFGRHLATVKYNILLAPLFISHIYKHKDAEEYSENAVSATGLKVRLESFVLDLHQRREEFNTLVKSKNAQSRTTGIKIHAAQLDLASADVRAISASLQGTTTEAIKKGSLGALVHEQDDKPDISRFKIPDNDYSWIDMDDFVELDWILPTEPHPNTKILPLAFIPRLTYFRQTDVGGIIAGDPTRTSPFGNESKLTHFCIMSHDDDPKRVQAQLVKERLERLNTQIKSHSRDLGEAELTVIRTDYKDPEAIEAFETLRKHTHVLHTKKAFLEKMLEQMQTKTPADSHIKHSSQKSASDTEINLHEDTLNIPSNAEFESDFSNRFVIHNMQLKWNNTLRNIVLRYIHQNSQRRGFIYYMSRPAIKFILDMIEERNKAKSSRPAKPNSTSGTGRTASPPENGTHDKNNTHDIEERILNILSEGGRFKSTSFSTNHNNAFDGTIEDLTHGISDEFGPQNSYHVRLIAPQIQLQSDKNKKHVVLITAKGMDLKVVEVMDKDRLSDDVSGLVQRRFLLNMDSTQFFVTHHKWYLTTLLSSHLGSQYGTPTGSTWPPWVPMEVMFDFQTDPFGFKRVVQKTSAMLRYDKYNNLRLKYNDEVNCEEVDVPSTEVTEARMDNLWVEFPQARAICNSSQYYAMYVIVLDLLMYNEPLEKTRSERLEKIMLASDFSDLSGTPEMVQKLQDRIRQMEEIKNHFQIYSQYLDQRGWEDRLLLERDLAVCEDELFFMMKAITTSQRKYDSASDSHALLKWSISVQDIVWHLMHDSNEPLVELQLKDLEYDRTDNSDGSHMNLFRVGRILGLNLLPDSTYPEMIGPYHDVERGAGHENESTDMIRVYWHMLEAIAGIPVMDRFEVRAHPMKVQLELEVGKRLFEYIFPGMDGDTGTSHKHEGSASRTNLLSLEDGDTESMESSTSKLSNLTVEKDASSGFATRAGSLELRLRPTLNSLAPQERSSKKAVSIHSGEGHAFRLFRSRAPDKTLAKKASQDSLRSGPRPGILGRSSTGFSSKETRESNGSENKKLSRFALRRGTYDDKQRSDDLTKMITRASNYMTFAHIKMPSVVLCLSYKGKDQRNFEDVHDFVFRLPDIEWQNKTWSNLDLALALKKAVVKALISHTGAIIGNKFSRHKPNAQQRNKLREMAGSSVLLTSSKNSSQQYAGSINDSDDSSSMYGTSPVDYSRSPPRSTRSTHSSIPGPGSMSRSSSIASNRSYSGSTNNNRPAVPAFLMMTPPTPVEGSMTDISGPGTDMIRPKTSASNLSKSPGRRKIGERPSTSASNLGPIDRRKGGGGGGFKDKFNALTHLMTHRDGSSLKDSETETGEGVPEMRESRIPTMNKRMSWAPGSKKGH